jgi:hypothetical protein
MTVIDSDHAWAEHDYEIAQGAAWNRYIDIMDENDQAIDLTGYHALMQIRPTPESDQILFQWKDTAPESNVTINSPVGRVAWTTTAAQTSIFDFDEAVFDLFLTPPSTAAWRALAGKMKLVPMVSRV